MSLQPTLWIPPPKKRQSYSHPERFLTVEQRTPYRHSADFGTSIVQRNEADVVPSSEQEGSTSRCNSGGTYGSNLLNHLKSVLPWKDSGLWTPPDSRRTSMYISPQQNKELYDGSIEAKPLPPFPIETYLEEDTKGIDSSNSKFRYVCGRKFLKDTGEECCKTLDLTSKSFCVTDLTHADDLKYRRFILVTCR